MQLSQTPNTKAYPNPQRLGTPNPEDYSGLFLRIPNKENFQHLPSIILDKEVAGEANAIMASIKETTERSADTVIINKEEAEYSKAVAQLEAIKRHIVDINRNSHGHNPDLFSKLEAEKERLENKVRELSYFAPKNEQGLTPNDTHDLNNAQAIADACKAVREDEIKDLEARKEKAKQEKAEKAERAKKLSIFERLKRFASPTYALKKEEERLAAEDSVTVTSKKASKKAKTTQTTISNPAGLYEDAKAKLQVVHSQILANTLGGKVIDTAKDQDLRAQEEALAMELRYFAPKNLKGETPNDVKTSEEYTEELNHSYAVAEACQAVREAEIQDMEAGREIAKKEAKAKKESYISKVKGLWSSPKNWFRKGLQAVGVVIGISSIGGVGCNNDATVGVTVENTGGYTQSPNGGQRGNGGGTNVNEIVSHAEEADTQVQTCNIKDKPQETVCPPCPPTDPRIITIEMEEPRIITVEMKTTIYKNPSKTPKTPVVKPAPTVKTPEVKTPETPEVKTPSTIYTPMECELASSLAKAEIAKLRAEYAKLQKTGGSAGTAHYVANASEFINLADQWVKERDKHRGNPEGWTKENHNQIRFYINEAKKALAFFRNAPKNQLSFQCLETKSAINSALRAYNAKITTPALTQTLNGMEAQRQNICAPTNNGNTSSRISHLTTIGENAQYYKNLQQRPVGTGTIDGL